MQDKVQSTKYKNPSTRIRPFLLLECALGKGGGQTACSQEHCRGMQCLTAVCPRGDGTKGTNSFFVPSVHFVLFVALLDGHGFGQVARLVDVTAAPHCYVIREQLQRDDRENR